MITRPSTCLKPVELRRVAKDKLSMSDDIEYRAFAVGTDGHFIRPYMFVAKDDAAAIRHARQFVDRYDVEIWSGERLLCRLPAAN